MIVDQERREVLKGAAAVSAIALLGRPAFAQPARDYRDFFSPELPDLRVLGTKPAWSEEVHQATLILNGLPTSSALAIFRELAANTTTNREDELYRGGWRERWNPVIVTMFQETDTRPSGDLTAWCAASLNWALKRAGLKGTGSAASGSFRDYPAKGGTTTPREGDVVVFRSADARKARLGHGHVGIFISQTATHVQVLGGNQINRAGHHEFSSKAIPKSGPALVLHSFQSMSAFPHA